MSIPNYHSTNCPWYGVDLNNDQALDDMDDTPCLCSKAIKYPHIKVKLVGEDGNAFAIIGQTCTAMRKAGLTTEQWHEYRDLAMKTDYDNLLRVTLEFVNVE